MFCGKTLQGSTMLNQKQSLFTQFTGASLIPTTRKRLRQQALVQAQLIYGNGYGGDNPKQSKGSPLILPGRHNQQQQQKQQQKIILPGQMQKPQVPGGGGLDMSNIDVDDKDLPPVVKQFRPPTGFMDEKPFEDPTKNMDLDIMLQRLQALAGKWYDLALFIPRLHENGYEAQILSEITGLFPSQQSKWVASAHIYNYLKQDGVSEETLLYFDGHDGPELLYELRYLTAEQRVLCIDYIVMNNYDARQCRLLARAMKDYDRKSDMVLGFEENPGDILAFKYYRDVLESKEEEAIDTLIQKALKVAESDTAKDRIKSIREFSEDLESALELKKALTVLRLEPDELGYCPIPVLGKLGKVSHEVLPSAPKSAAEGVFGIFEIPPSQTEQSWVALPMWKALVKSQRPIALQIPDVSTNSLLMQIIGAFQQAGQQQFTGPGLIVFDLKLERNRDGQIQTQAEEFFIVKDDEGMLQLKAGVQLEDDMDDDIMGQVLFLCRPPKREIAMTGAGTLEV
eukprot:TRINITY_DN4007_c1_g2_i1.p1 TRINITY_DN4007_c1_g2~~TRINITY_DN4007_c1_g2_i1.p1  ORF type:complete len:511 (-),score=77.39 TRINITY_DN4007_c1_g2_i1:393-1925(-)